MVRLVTADDLCVALQNVLADQLPKVVAALAEAGKIEAADFPAVKTWTQVPTLDALRAATAVFPAGAVTSPGTTGRVEEYPEGVDAAWRVAAGVFDRGSDWSATQRKIRVWAACIRGVALQNRTLGGVATGVRFVGESYRQISANNSHRTLGGCSVEFDISAANVVDLGDLDPGPRPTVATVHKSVTVRTTQE